MSKVSLVRVPEKPFDEEVQGAVESAVDLLGGAAAFARAGQKVLIKPNWWCWPGTGPREEAYYIYGTSDRRIVLATARIFARVGCRVMIGEDPAVNRSVKKVYEGFKAAELAQRAGAELVNLRGGGYRTVPAPAGREFKELRINAIALEADLIVSVPLLKAHQLTGVTLTLKNMKGILPPVEKRAFHQRNLSQGIADLASVVKPGLTVMDALIASDNWVAGGGIRPMNLVVAGDDALAIDAVGCHLMQADPRQIDHLRFAGEMGLGEIDLDRIEVLGERIEDFSVPFTLPADPLKIASELSNIEIRVGEACSGCLNRLGNIFTKLGIEELSQSGEITFIVGKKVRPDGDRTNILMGPCTARYREDGIYLPDCPPMEVDIQNAIRYAAGKEAEMRYYWDGAELRRD